MDNTYQEFISPTPGKIKHDLLSEIETGGPHTKESLYRPLFFLFSITTLFCTGIFGLAFAAYANIAWGPITAFKYDIAAGAFSVCSIVVALALLVYFISRIVVVHRGSVLVTSLLGEPVVFGTGLHWIGPLYRIYGRLEINSSDNVQMGPYRLLTVDVGTVAKTYYNGTLVILEAGRHILDSTKHNHTFVEFIDMKQQTVEVKMRAATNDNVMLKLTLDVIYAIHDADTYCRSVTDKQKACVDRASILMTSLFKRHAFDELFSISLREDGNISSTHAPIVPRDSNPLDPLNTQPANDRDTKMELVQMTNEFIREFSNNMSAIGIRIINVGFSNLEIESTELAQQLAKRSVIRVNVACMVANAEANASVVEKNAQAEAKAKLIIAQATKDSATLLDTPIAQKLAEWEALKNATKQGTVVYANTPTLIQNLVSSNS
jgi:regulator of protease activity HflC (stomatin/prohibitin superfamily)